MRTTLVATLSASLLTGCVAAEEHDLATTDQALNGDSWVTADDNPYSAGMGAENYGVAISPVTHKILVAGNRTETSGSVLWIVRGSPNGSSGFGLNHTFKLTGGANSQAANVAVDSTGVWYVLGNSQDASGDWHWIVLRSTDDAMTWNRTFDVVQTGRPTGITIDAQQNVYISGSSVDANGVHAKIYRGANQGTLWALVAAYTAPTNNNIDLAGMCVGNYQGQTHVFAIGSYSYPNVSANIAWAVHSGDQGVHWATAFTYQPMVSSVGTGCAGSPNADVYFGTNGQDNGTSQWDVIDATSYYPFVHTDDVVSSTSGDLSAAIGTAWANARPYGVGYVEQPAGVSWRVRFKSGGTWKDSDIFNYGTSFLFSQAENAAYDSVRGLYVVGKAYDDAGRLHGIVRQRL